MPRPQYTNTRRLDPVSAWSLLDGPEGSGWEVAERHADNTVTLGTPPLRRAAGSSASVHAIHSGATKERHWDLRVRRAGSEHTGGAWWPDGESARRDFAFRREQLEADTDGDEQLIRIELIDADGQLHDQMVVLAGAITDVPGDVDLGDSSRAPSAFISWAHRGTDWSSAQAAGWERTIAEFTGQLRASGIDADVDLFHLNDADINWQIYGPNRIASSDFTLIAVTRAYRERWEGTNPPTEGAGAAREAHALKGMFDRHQGDFQRRVKIVLLEEATDADIPSELLALQRFRIADLSRPDSLEDLLRTLTDQPAYPIPQIGHLPILPPRINEALEPAPTANRRAQLLQAAEFVDAQLASVNLHEASDQTTSDSAVSEPTRRRASLEGLLRGVRLRDGTADEAWAIDDGPIPVPAIADHLRYRWELRRVDEKRTIMVELSGTVVASDPSGLATMIADAVASRGRSVIETKCLDARDATSIIKVTTSGLQLL